MAIQFTDDEIETIKSVLQEWGSDCPDTDGEKVQELRYKLGLEKRPTPEQIAEWDRKRKEWAESESGILFSKIMASADNYLEQIAKNLQATPDILYDVTEIGASLRIRLPNDYNGNKNDK